MEFRDLLRRVVDNAPYLGLWVGRFVPNRRSLERTNDGCAASMSRLTNGRRSRRPSRFSKRRAAEAAGFPDSL